MVTAWLIWTIIQSSASSCVHFKAVCKVLFPFYRQVFVRSSQVQRFLVLVVFFYPFSERLLQLYFIIRWSPKFIHFYWKSLLDICYFCFNNFVFSSSFSFLLLSARFQINVEGNIYSLVIIPWDHPWNFQFSVRVKSKTYFFVLLVCLNYRSTETKFLTQAH